MIKSYFIIAWRNIIRNKVYSIINILGLALGICACIVIYLITSYELSFDKFHPDKDRIYRIVGEGHAPTGETMFLNSVIPEVAGFQRQIPGFEAQAGFHNYGGHIKIPQGSQPAKKFENRITGSRSSTAIITWPQYFDIFTYEWLAGDAASLNAPFKVVLSASRARQYFGDIPPDSMLGKTVIYDDSLRVTVSGIVKDWNKNSDLSFTDFISISTATHSFLRSQIPTDDWSSLQIHNSMTFVKLVKGTTAAQVNERFATYIKQHVTWNKPGASFRMWLQPLTEMHFTNEFHRGDDGDDFDKPYLPTLYALMGLALFILLIAVVNFINLSTAQSLYRAKEIGVRKVMGSNKTNIVFQFLTETFVLTLMAVALSVLLVNPVLAAFHSFIRQGIIFHPFAPSTLLFLFIVTLVTSLLAGFYPAKVLAAYLPVLSLKGAVTNAGGGKGNLRKGLIVFQFSIALVFIIGSLVMGNQIRFMRDTDKGFNSEAILTMNHWRDRNGQIKILAGGIRHIPGIEKVILQSNPPAGMGRGMEIFKYKGRGREQIDLPVSFDAGDENFIPFYRMKLLAGRNIMPGDSLKEVVINETCSRAMGFLRPEEAVGTFLYKNDRPYPVVGVVTDFHEGSFHEAIRPLVIGRRPEREWSISVKLTAAGKQKRDMKPILSALTAAWKKVYPDEPFNYTFLDDALTWLYEQETKTAWLMNTAMLITIFISSIGLFGLALFSAGRRTKEIGIRKVLGASVAQLTALLSKDFMKLVLIAIVIASPVAWYFMNQWLQDFVYRTRISGWVFIGAGLGAIGIALIPVGFQAIRAAVANPVKNLRAE